MPYNDEVNRHVKRVVSSINRRFIAHGDLLGNTNAINSKNPSVEPQGSSLLGQGRTIGGSKGCASWSAGAATKHYEKSDEPSEKTGGAILGPGRADIFWGHGKYAEIAAGNMKHKGSLYFLILKSEKK